MEDPVTKVLHYGLLLLLATLLLPLSACVPKPPLPPSIPDVPPAEVQKLQPVDWSEVEGWPGDSLQASLGAFLQSCRVLGKREGWQQVCSEAAGHKAANDERIAEFFESRFVPHRINNDDGSTTGLITGYYVPDLRGSRVRTQRYRYPLYGPPEDMLTIDLSSVYPELGSYRLRGRLEGKRVVPYYDREALDAGVASLKGSELLWVDDPVELFFMHIQGSGRILFENGDAEMVNYADQNGHPFRSIGKLLIERGEMSRHQMSMQNIRAWARKHPELADDLLAENPSYIFFRELPDMPTPPGALGVPLTPEVSIAVDRRTVPLGAPVFLATTWPLNPQPLQRLMVAQDTGGAIKGNVRADFFWGCGHEAGALAGRMKQDGRMWVLLPRTDKDVTEEGESLMASDTAGGRDG